MPSHYTLRESDIVPSCGIASFDSYLRTFCQDADHSSDSSKMKGAMTPRQIMMVPRAAMKMASRQGSCVVMCRLRIRVTIHFSGSRPRRIVPTGYAVPALIVIGIALDEGAQNSDTSSDPIRSSARQNNQLRFISRAAVLLKQSFTQKAVMLYVSKITARRAAKDA